MGNIENFRQFFLETQQSVAAEIQQRDINQTIKVQTEENLRKEAEKQNDIEKKRLFNEIGLLDLLQEVIEEGVVRMSDEPIYAYIKGKLFPRKVKDFHPAVIQWKNYYDNDEISEFRLFFINNNGHCNIRFQSKRNIHTVSISASYYDFNEKYQNIILDKKNLEESLAIALATAAPSSKSEK